MAVADPGRRFRHLSVPQALGSVSHFWLGAVDGLAPVGAWAAVTNEMPLQAWALGGAVALWVTGFDLLYSLFDLDVDRAQGLHSVAARLGPKAAFLLARACHVGTVACLALAGLGLSVKSSIGSALRPSARCSPTSTCWSHRTTGAGSTPAFFTTNGVISVTVFSFVLADVLAT